MQDAPESTALDARRPAPIDFLAAVLLVATVVLHVVAMTPTYFKGSGSLTSQPDQAALYSVLAAAWALALVIGLTGPHRTPVSAGLAVGVALTELGFRASDLGLSTQLSAGRGLWLMEAAWVVGAVAALTAVLAARSRHRTRSGPAEKVEEATPTEWRIDWAQATGHAHAPNPYAPEGVEGQGHQEQPGSRRSEPALSERTTPMTLTGDEASASVPGSAPEPRATTPISAQDPTASLAVTSDDPTTSTPVVAEEQAASGPAPRGGDTSVLPVVPEADEDPHERLAWTLLVVILAAVVAGAFLPAWDHAVAVSTVTGQTVTRSLGNAWEAPWQQSVGTFVAAAALLVVPIVAIRLRNKAVGAAAVVGALLVLAAQFVAAVVQVDQPVPPSDFGITPSQVQNLGLQMSLKLTGWFTLDTLAAYALFAAVMVWATLRSTQENSAGISPSAPDWRSEEIRSAS